MRKCLKFYINGEWVEPVIANTVDVINPATEDVSGQISLGSSEDVNKAVAAAQSAFKTYSKVSVKERILLLENIATEYDQCKEKMAQAITEEMGSPITFSRNIHTPFGSAHFRAMAELLKTFSFIEKDHAITIVREPIGVCGLITPWNWPILQVSGKLATGIAAGCTTVLKPAELSPYSAALLFEVLAKAGVPKGVVNFVNGTGPIVGNAINAHPDIKMVSFTGSQRAGLEVARTAAVTVKRVGLELGGKSPFIILEDASLQEAAKMAVMSVMLNAGQTCAAGTRTLIPVSKKEELVALIKKEVEAFTVGDPLGGAMMGPVVSKARWDEIQKYIQLGLDQKATLLTGGLGRPQGLTKGYYVKPTVFDNVKNSMTIAQEEIFGPVMSLIPYHTIDEAITIANDSIFGLCAYVVGKNPEIIQKIAYALESGTVCINNMGGNILSPWGGYKQSGVGREWGAHGLMEYLQVKAIF